MGAAGGFPGRGQQQQGGRGRGQQQQGGRGGAYDLDQRWWQQQQQQPPQELDFGQQPATYVGGMIVQPPGLHSCSPSGPGRTVFGDYLARAQHVSRNSSSSNDSNLMTLGALVPLGNSSQQGADASAAASSSSQATAAGRVVTDNQSYDAAASGSSSSSNSSSMDRRTDGPDLLLAQAKPGGRRVAIKPRGAEAVVPGVDDQPAAVGAPADQPAAGAPADPLSKLRHSVLTAPIIMQLREMLRLAGGTDTGAMREGCRQLGLAFDPQMCQGLVLDAAFGVFDDDRAYNSGCSSSSSTAGLSPQQWQQLQQQQQQYSSSTAGLPASGQDGSSGGQAPGLFVQTGAMRPASAVNSSRAGVQGSSSSSSSTAGQPYKQALDSEVVEFNIADPMQVCGDIAGKPVKIVVDIGCGLSVLDKKTAQLLVPALSQPHCPCDLISLEEAMRVGMFATPLQVPATHVLRNVPVGLGPGMYPMNFLVMDRANFSITLGLDFCNAYGASILSRSFRDRRVGAALLMPVPPRFARRGWVRPPPPRHVPQHLRASWIFTSHIPGHYVVHRHRRRGTRVPLQALLA
jgi:hypothetical protein